MDNNCYFKMMFKGQELLKPGSWKSLPNSFKEESNLDILHLGPRLWHSCLPLCHPSQFCNTDGNPLKDSVTRMDLQ